MKSRIRQRRPEVVSSRTKSICFGTTLIILSLTRFSRPFVLTYTASYTEASRHQRMAKRMYALANNHDAMGYKGILSSSSKSYIPSTSPSCEGLSKFHLSILSRTVDVQCFVTGRYPVIVSVQENPTRRWLNVGRSEKFAETDLLVNGTAPTRSLASLDRFHWLDDAERNVLQNECGMMSLEFLAEIQLERPSYLQILDGQGAGHTAATAKSINEYGVNSKFGITATTSSNDRLWVTGFSLVGRQSMVTAVDCQTCNIQTIHDRSRRTMLWPNEVQVVPRNLLASYQKQLLEDNSIQPHNRASVTDIYHQARVNEITTQQQQQPSRTPTKAYPYQDAVLVCDGFLVPTKDKGGIYVIHNPGHASTERIVCLTDERDRWFYHRAVWLDLTNDGRLSILTARCQVSTALNNKPSVEGMITSGITKAGELIWLECPVPASFDPTTNTLLEEDGTKFDPFGKNHLPWKAHVLATGVDVMFAVADMDPLDETIEVLSSQFFRERVMLHSILPGPTPKVVFDRIIDEKCGRAFCSVLADLEAVNTDSNACDIRGQNSPLVVDSGSTVECLVTGDSFTHLLVTSHECSYVTESDGFETLRSQESSDSLHSKSKMSTKHHVPDSRSSVEGGSLFAYRVPRWWKTDTWHRSIVATGFKVNSKIGNMINPGAPGFAYTFHSKKSDAKEGKRPMIAVAGDCAESAYIFRPAMYNSNDPKPSDPSTHYKLMVEIQCESTVGSIAVGYNDFSATERESGYAKLYVPCYERDMILVFGLGSGADDNDGW